MAAEALPRHEVDNLDSLDRGITTASALELEVCEDEIALPLIEFIEDLQTALETIPKKFRKTAIVRIRGYGEYVSLRGCVEFKRPETDEEFAARKRWLASLDTEREKRDRSEFARLKAKYER